MTDSNPFINLEGNEEVDKSTTSQPQSAPISQIQPEKQRSTNVEDIQISEITGPLVILFGPTQIGKTVTLLRLDEFIKGKYDVECEKHFWEDSDYYREKVEAFEELRRNQQYAPEGTGKVDFLLLNVSYGGERFCQILEAPGEHFFDRKNPDAPFPFYLNKLFSADYRKIFIFLFELNMFDSDASFKDYADKIAQLVSQQARPRRDRIIIVCNKCDEHPQYWKNGKPVEREFRNRLFNHTSFKKLKETLNNSNFKYIPFVTFTSGTFTKTGSEIKGKDQTFAHSNDEFPKQLWSKIHNHVKETWFGSLRFW